MRKVQIILTLIIGILLWIGFCTDYSFVGTIPDIIFILIVFAISTISFVMILSWDITKWSTKFRNIMFCLPGLIGGFLFIAYIFTYLIGNFPFYFEYDEIMHEQIIQESTSPDGLKTAIVHFREVGAYSGGNGRILINIRYRWIPLVEKDVYYLRVSHANRNTRNYVSWLDNETLYSNERQEKIPVGIVKFHIPFIVR